VKNEKNKDAQVTIKTALLNKLKDTIDILTSPARRAGAK